MTNQVSRTNIILEYDKAPKPGRNKPMNIIQFFMPEFIKNKKMKELFRLTSDAFQSEMPDLRGLSFEECLSKYAFYTKEQAERCLRNGSAEEVKARFYENSFVFGRNLRKRLHIISWKESAFVFKAIYKLIGIDFQYVGQTVPASGTGGCVNFTDECKLDRNGCKLDQNERGLCRNEFAIRRCFFSGFYSPEVCRLISSLDEGLAAGLTGGKLCFVQRITDGGSCCKGHIDRMIKRERQHSFAGF